MYSSPNSGLAQLKYLELYPGLFTRPESQRNYFVSHNTLTRSTGSLFAVVVFVGVL